jgi:hypothetical protein
MASAAFHREGEDSDKIPLRKEKTYWTHIPGASQDCPHGEELNGSSMQTFGAGHGPGCRLNPPQLGYFGVGGLACRSRSLLSPKLTRAVARVKRAMQMSRLLGKNIVALSSDAAFYALTSDRSAAARVGSDIQNPKRNTNSRISIPIYPQMSPNRR